jgi:hypothetical protein
MLQRRILTISVLLLSCLVATAKDKKKALLPADVLRAHTVLVLVDPSAGTDVQNPNANRTAQEDVEKALMEWGRFSLALDARTADLIKSPGVPAVEVFRKLIADSEKQLAATP